MKVSQGKYAATQAASETGELACGTWTRLDAPITEIDTDLATTTTLEEAWDITRGPEATVNRLETLIKQTVADSPVPQADIAGIGVGLLAQVGLRAPSPAALP